MTPEARKKKNEYKRKYRANMSPEARAAANEYVKEWKRNNKDRVRQYNVDYWERKAASLTSAMLQGQKEEEDEGSIKNCDFMINIMTWNEN